MFGMNDAVMMTPISTATHAPRPPTSVSSMKYTISRTDVWKNGSGMANRIFGSYRQPRASSTVVPRVVTVNRASLGSLDWFSDTSTFVR